MEKDNEVSFEVKFTTGYVQLEIIIDPDINFLDALCDLGGLFGAVTAGIVIAMQLFEKQAHKNQDKMNKIRESHKQWVNKWRRTLGLPVVEKIFTTDDDDPGAPNKHPHDHDHHSPHDHDHHSPHKKASQTQALARAGFGRNKGMKGMLKRAALKRAQEQARKHAEHHEDHHHHSPHHSPKKNKTGENSDRPEFYKH